MDMSAEHVYSVQRLVGALRARLEGDFPDLWVQGEISNLACPASGHRYFSLSEGDALLRCVLFGGRRRRVAEPADGMQALVRGRISVYEPRGDLQLIVSYLEEAGEGAMRREFERLKRKLSEQGLFDARHKQALPAYPRAIGVLTSSSGVVLHDIRVTLRQRYPLARLVLYPTTVQGAEAAASVIHMLRIANARREVDVLILARGGGSLEDLQAFNDEQAARAVFTSALPVISAIGHEVDVTLTDLVADHRAATPTAAAQLAAPAQTYLQEVLRAAGDALRAAAQRRVHDLAQRLDYASARLPHPGRRLQYARQAQIAIRKELGHLIGHRLGQLRMRLQRQTTELRQASPQASLTQHRRRVDTAHRRLRDTVAARCAAAEQRVRQLAAQASLMNPAHTLARGYAILQNGRGAVVVDVKQTRAGEALTARVARGQFRCLVGERLDEG